MVFSFSYFLSPFLEFSIESSGFLHYQKSTRRRETGYTPFTICNPYIWGGSSEAEQQTVNLWVGIS